MKTKIQKWGNGLGVRIPKNITEEKSLSEGLDVNVILKDNQIVIEPIQEKVSLKSMLTKVSVDNLRGETDMV